ncbi:LPS glycosyltransferase [Halobacterium salinarum NRC-1]|uniref:LPS glycosyltransferase n=4 Tax=Halobacterium salinarum TaxID=2242 RepID=Q9HSV4_HALSA|nr:LPS glycosyltransferase [Halobacterium salinarum NRC-1]
MARLLSELQPSEFDITVVAIADTPPDVVSMLPDHVEVKHLKMTRRTALLQLGEISKIVKSTDILVCSLFHATAIGVPLGLLLQVPKLLVWQHSTSYSNQIRSAYYRLAYRAADRVLADSDAVMEMLVDSVGVPDQKISTLPIAGIDVKEYQPSKTHPSHENITVSTVGRLANVKGYDDLIRCARDIGDDLQFQIAGEGEERERLESKTPDNVNFQGMVPNEQIPQFLNNSDIYFQPSKYEGLCMAVIEAMACGLPVVASDVGGITESVVPGETGFLCRPRDIDCFSERLQQLSENPALRKQMGTAGRKRVISEYSQKALARQFRKAIDQTETV